MQIDATLQASSKDCGLAALRFYLQVFFGVSPNDIGPPQIQDAAELTLAQLIAMARTVGVALQGIEISADELAAFPRPYIWLQERNERTAAHYVVVLSAHGKRELFFDPMFGYRSKALAETTSRIAVR